MILEIRHIFIQGVPKSAFLSVIFETPRWLTKSIYEHDRPWHGKGVRRWRHKMQVHFLYANPHLPWPVITKMTLIWTFPKIEIQLEQLVQLFVIGVVIQLINDFKLEFSMKDWYSIWASWTVVCLLGCCSIDKLIIGSHLVWIKLTVQFKRVLLC